MSQLQKQWDKEFQQQMQAMYASEFEDFNLCSNQYTTWQY